jgi:hypothetical protein
MERIIVFDVFDPSSKFILLWDSIQILLIIWVFAWIPLKISFGLEKFEQLFNTAIYFNTEIFVLILLAIDSLISLNLAII